MLSIISQNTLRTLVWGNGHQCCLMLNVLPTGVARLVWVYAAVRNALLNALAAFKFPGLSNGALLVWTGILVYMYGMYGHRAS